MTCLRVWSHHAVLPLLPTPVAILHSVPSRLPVCGSYIERAQSSSGRSKFMLELIASLLLEKYQLGSSTKNLSQFLSEVAQELYSIKFKKRVPLASINLHVLKNTSLPAERQTLTSVLVNQNAGCETRRKSHNSVHVSVELHLQYVGMATVIPTSASACFALETSKLCSFHSKQNPNWSPRCEYVSGDVVTVSSDAVTAPFSINANITSGKLYHNSLLEEHYRI